MKTQAVIDRFEGDKAVLMVGEERDELVVPRALLPGAVKEGDWLQLEAEDDQVLAAALDNEATDRARESIEAKLRRLRKKE